MIKGREGFNQLFNKIYKGNAEAIDISNRVLNIASTWDDLVDKDRDLKEDEINSAFLNAIFEVQNLPLWNQCGLNHHILNCYLRWRDANTIEKGNPSEDDLNKCYMLRAGLYDLFVIIAYCLYGDVWAKEIGPLVRRFYGESLNDYKEEMICQIQLRAQ